MEAYAPGGGSGSGMLAEGSPAGPSRMGVIVVRATPADLAAVRALLVDASLPLDGVDQAFEHGVVAVAEGAIVGAAAVEPYGTDGLLRSVVVEASRRGTGLGRALVETAESLAAGIGVRDLYLLTETAIDWFPRLGYAPLPRADAPPGIAGSREFSVVCRDTGVLMRKALAPA